MLSAQAKHGSKHMVLAVTFMTHLQLLKNTQPFFSSMKKHTQAFFYSLDDIWVLTLPSVTFIDS